MLLRRLDCQTPPTKLPRKNGSLQTCELRSAQLERAASRQGRGGEGALGVVFILTGDSDRAIEALERACNGQPSDVQCWNDLSVAYLARAERTDDQDDLLRALAAADRSLSADPRLAEALFNRAIALERLSRTQEAIEAWTSAQQNDPQSPWADEARSHLQGLSAVVR
jgi:tetratricopeptide (TPR) repeat protein